MRWASLLAQVVKNPPAVVGDLGLIPGLEGSPEDPSWKHTPILAWRIPWTEEAGSYIGLQRVRHNLSNLVQLYNEYLLKYS